MKATNFLTLRPGCMTARAPLWLGEVESERVKFGITHHEAHAFHSVLIMLVTAMSAGCGFTSQPSRHAASPTVFCANQDQDLGDILVDRHEPYTAEFLIENRGDAVLEIQGIVVGCACLRPQITQRKIPVGGRAVLRVGIRRLTAEERRATITVRTNDRVRPVLRLSLSWRANAPVIFEPASLDFGNLIAGESAEATVRVTRHAPSHGAVQAIGEPRHRLEGLDARWAEGTMNNEVWATRSMLVRVTAMETIRETHGLIEIDLPGSRANIVTLPVQWRVRRLVEVSPESLFLGSGGPGDQRRRTVVVHVPASRRLVIREVVVQPPSEELTVVRENESDRAVSLRIDARFPTQSGAHRSELRIACAEPTEMVLVVPVTLHVNAIR